MTEKNNSPQDNVATNNTEDSEKMSSHNETSTSQTALSHTATPQSNNSTPCSTNADDGGDQTCAHTPTYNVERAKQPMPEERAWLEKVKPHLHEIEKLRAGMATMSQIADFLKISRKTLYLIKAKKPELKEIFERMNARREEHLVGKLYELAQGTAVRVEETKTKDDDGKLSISQQKTTRLEPSLSALMALLKHFHGWSDNPVVDNAIVAHMSKEEIAKKTAEILGISDVTKRLRRPDRQTENPPETSDEQTNKENNNNE